LQLAGISITLSSCKLVIFGVVAVCQDTMKINCLNNLVIAIMAVASSMIKMIKWS